MKNKQGITLIALIITIIILLILVGVSVNLLIKGDLFGSAEKAVNGTNAKVEEQQTRVDELMRELNQVEAKNAVHDWQYTDNTRAQIRCTCSKCKAFNDGDSTGRTLSIGQQIGETQYITASTSITAERSGFTRWNSTTNQAEPVDQTLDLDNEEIKWVVFGYKDKNNDGKNEILLLTTEKPIEQAITFEGESGYNNGIEEIEKMCKELYGSNVSGITIEDVNAVLGYKPEGGMYFDENNNIQTTGNFTTKLCDLSIWSIMKKNGTNTPDGVNTESALGNYELNGFWYVADKKVNSRDPIISNNIADSVKAMIFGSNCDYEYWLASNGVDADTNNAYFALGCVASGGVYLNAGSMFESSGGRMEFNHNLRPLLFLISEIPYAGDILFTTFTPKSNVPG